MRLSKLTLFSKRESFRITFLIRSLIDSPKFYILKKIFDFWDQLVYFHINKIALYLIASFIIFYEIYDFLLQILLYTKNLCILLPGK